MKRYLLTTTVLFTLGCGVSFGQNNSTKTEDEKAIRANVEQMVNGWNAKSGVEFAKPGLQMSPNEFDKRLELVYFS